MSKSVNRLFKQFVPEHYDIIFNISKDKKSFTGSVVIKGRKSGRPSKRITLHQKGLKTTNHKVTVTDKKSGSREIPVSRIVNHKAYDELRLHFESDIYPAEYEISMDFSGVITKNMDGVYPCFFKDNNAEKELVATQFESHHAREAFPCIDEPEAKATFSLTLSSPLGGVLLSNTPIVDEKTKDGIITTEFEKTPIMSTYLLAFVAGELEYLESSSKSGVKIRTYATKNQIKHTEFALEIAVKCMDFYEDYYDIPFPLEKCDFVALPDFASGAMENWGLITFREQALLVDTEHTSLGAKQYVALVVAHELTHQWFGNLVTMQWWTDLWLNEGFASWMEYLAVDSIYPEWHLWTQFIVDEQQHALKLDGLEHTHAIEVAVNHPDEIRTIFDAISYQKGASVIHMLHDFLGKEGFRDGLRHYLKSHSYKNTKTIDLWQALEDITKKPVKDFMHAWTTQLGFPLLQVEEASDHLKITQSRFVSNPTSPARADKNIWPNPLHAEGLGKIVADKKVSNIPLNSGQAPTKLNINQTAFYRVDYSHDLQQKQIIDLKSGKYHSIDRMGLLADSFEVTKAGYQPISEYLDLLEHFRSEDSLSVWEIIAGSLSTIRSVLSTSDTDDTLRDILKPFVKKLVKPNMDKLGFDKKDTESHLDTLLRPIIFSLSLSSDTTETLNFAKEQYGNKLSGKNNINPDLRSSIYSTIARKGGMPEYEQFLKMYKETDSSEEKLSITSALTSFKQPEVHEKVLKLIKSDVVRLQDISYWIAYSLMNRYSKQATWDWLRDNWSWLTNNIGSDLSFSRTPVYAARNFADEKFIKEYVEFFTKNMNMTLKRSYNQGLEIVQTNHAWRERDSEAVLKWFKNKQ